MLIAGVCVAVSTPNDGPHIGVCTTHPVLRHGDNSYGTFYETTPDQWKAEVNDPTADLYKSVPGIYVQGYGLMCSISDVFTYGGDPAKFKDAGYTVNGVGDKTPEGVSIEDWGAIYEYYVPSA